jgi:hypothetical protein
MYARNRARRIAITAGVVAAVAGNVARVAARRKPN